MNNHLPHAARCSDTDSDAPGARQGDGRARCLRPASSRCSGAGPIIRTLTIGRARLGTAMLDALSPHLTSTLCPPPLPLLLSSLLHPNSPPLPLGFSQPAHVAITLARLDWHFCLWCGDFGSRNSYGEQDLHLTITSNNNNARSGAPEPVARVAMAGLAESRELRRALRRTTRQGRLQPLTRLSF